MKYLFPAMLGLLLAACSTDSKPDPTEVSRQADRDAAPKGTGAIGAPCRYGKRPKGVLLAVMHRDGRAYIGEMTYADLEKMAPRINWRTTSRIAAVVAAPSVNVFSVRVDGNCYDARRKVYYNCIKHQRADLRDIRVMVRGMEADPAAQRAVRLCEQQVLRRVAEKTDEEIAHRNLRCRVVTQRWCRPPRPAPAKKAPAARKKSNGK